MFLKTEDLTKTYQTKGKEAIDALKNVSLSFPHNGLVFLLGESGSGKSTLLSILGGLAKPTSGDVFFFGKSLSSMSEDEITAYRNFDNGFVLQENVFIDDLDVSRNVMLGLKENEENVSAASESLKTVGLSGFDSRRINELSGGQKQRVAIARALVKKCSMMLCDEPTAALDEDTAARIFSLLKTLSNDHLIIVACHDRDAAFRYGDRIIEMNDGSVIRDLTAAPSGGGIVYSGDRVFIPKEHSMTTDEFAELANRLKKNEVTKIFAGPKTRSFIPTEQKEIDRKVEADKKRPNLFSAFSTPKRLWLSSLAKRKRRYVLSVAVLGLACTMFGSALVCSSYDVRRANIDTLLHASADVIAIRKEETFDDGSISYTKRGQLSKADVETLSSYFDLPIMGVGAKQKTSFINYRIGQISSSDDYTIVPLGNGVGIAEANRAFFESSNFKFVAGAYPENDESMVISTEIANFFRKYGYKDFVSENPELILEPGFEYEALIGKPLKVSDVELT
ncbi:MAG: ABC transporter ATP-binding protein, partial [Candidatus Enteromonas sp.]|nr:ABC transporter ATP-binding protein [Candidatus Enteromonas sp.]